MHFHFIPTASLIRDTEALAASLITTYPDIVGVVGIPRSGMLPATVMANCLHVPLAASTVSALPNYPLGSGDRMRGVESESWPSEGTILVVDDSCGSGKSLHRILRGVVGQGYRIVPVAIYSTGDFTFDQYYPPQKLKLRYHTTIPKPRVFQWNLFNHADTQHFAFDLDGIFCPDPPCREDAATSPDSPYLNYITTAPLIRPLHRRCRAIITSRLSRHLPATRDWLASKNIRYRQLLTHPARSAAERRKLNNHASVKAEAYKSLSKAWLYVESDIRQASEIAERSGKPVVCVEDWRIYGGTNV